MNTARRVLTLDEVRCSAPSVFATQPHHAVSSEYRFIPTVDMLETLMKDGWQPVQAGEHNVRKQGKAGYQKHLLRLRNPNLPKVGDSEVDLLVYNSHDRTSAFKFLAGLYRFVCANGMACGEDLFEPLSVRHIGYKAENVLDAAYRVVAAVPRIAESVDRMNVIQLFPEERKAFAQAALTVKYGLDDAGKIAAPIIAEKLLNYRRQEDNGNSLWQTLNIVQENLIRGGQRGWTIGSNGRMRRQSTRSVASISESTKLNQALWTLTESMAKLKTQA